MESPRVLLVDDEKALLFLLKRHLERQGHSVIAAVTAEEALEALSAASTGESWSPDVLITDETLPGATGTALATSLLYRYPDLVVLLCSGYSLSLDPIPAPLRHRAAILQKPYMPPALDAAIQAVLAARLSVRSASAS